MGEPLDFIRVSRVHIRMCQGDERREVHGVIERAALSLTDNPQQADLLFVDVVSLRQQPALRQQVLNAAKPEGTKVIILCRGERDQHHPLAMSLVNQNGVIPREMREELAAHVRRHLQAA